MKIKETFIAQVVDGEQILVDVGNEFSGIIRSNSTAAFIVDCLRAETSEEQIIETMYAKYAAPREAIARDVARILEQLRSVGAIEE